MPTEEILVLASSRKLGGRCVAGITRSGEWVRPVSGRPQGLFKAECAIEGRWPEVLDVVRFGFSEHLEDPAQPENRGKAVTEDDAAEGVEASLTLIEPESGVIFSMRPPEEEHGKYKPRVVFNFASKRYDLVLTDVPLEEAVRRAGVGEHMAEDLEIGDTDRALLTVSLGEAHNGWHTKLAAAVLFL